MSTLRKERQLKEVQSLLTKLGMEGPKRSKKASRQKGTLPYGGGVNRAANNYYSLKSETPRMTIKNGKMMICGMEPIADVEAQSDQTIHGGTGIDPANGTLFPWASSILRAYNQYKWRRCDLAFVGNQPTSVGGQLTVGVFFQSEEFSSWVSGSYTTSALQLADPSVTGPLYGNFATSDFNNNPMSVSIDCSDYKKRTPWLNVIANVSAGPEDNQSVEAYMGWSGSHTLTVGEPTLIGQIFCRYEIEVQRPTPLLAISSRAFQSVYNTAIGDYLASNETIQTQLASGSGTIYSQVFDFNGWFDYLYYLLGEIKSDVGFTTLSSPTRTAINNAYAGLSSFPGATHTQPASNPYTEFTSVINECDTLVSAIGSLPAFPVFNL